jgi:EAL domain-containing protein (putative c-di-GMP-specific phosphodiesterase class I)
MKAPAATGADPVPYRDRTDELREILVRQGSLGLLLIDLSELAQVEQSYGSAAFEHLLGMAREVILELRGSEVRSGDLLALNDRSGDAFLVFFSPRHDESTTTIADLKAAAERVEAHLNQRLSRLATPYLPGPRQVVVGYAYVFWNPLVLPERLVTRLVDEAWECVRVHRMQRAMQARTSLQEVLLEERLATVFQPVFDLKSRGVLGYEALTRGPLGTVFHMPTRLFDLAATSDLVFELDRKCRRRALQAAAKLPPQTKLFINVFPSTLYDPDFRGPVLGRQLQALGIRPERLVLEITEKYAIENYEVFAEALGGLTELGCAIAVDDVGAGYSGLEKIAHLSPRYLKFDRQLIKDIDSSYIRQEMTRALRAFGDRISSTVIAEGIERQAELETLLTLGVEYGQGFLLARPAAAGAPRPAGGWSED